jgi:hypothetical protein
MAQSAFYEESAGSAKSKKEARYYQIFLVASIVVFAVVAIWLFLSIGFVSSVIAEAKKQGTNAGVVFSLIVWFVGIALLWLFGFLLFRMRRRFNVSYDYIFVEDELRITKVFNGRKRKFLITLKADHMLKIGYAETDSFEDCRRGLNGKKPKFVTPNPEPSEEKQFIYILYSTTMGKDLYILECRTALLEYVVRAAGRNKFTKQ